MLRDAFLAYMATWSKKLRPNFLKDGLVAWAALCEKVPNIIVLSGCHNVRNSCNIRNVHNVRNVRNVRKVRNVRNSRTSA